jgi:hypothetical protein
LKVFIETKAKSKAMLTMMKDHQGMIIQEFEGQPFEFLQKGVDPSSAFRRFVAQNAHNQGGNPATTGRGQPGSSTCNHLVEFVDTTVKAVECGSPDVFSIF